MDYNYSDCRICQERKIAYDPIESYHKENGTPRIMLIGQDPTIRNKTKKVKCALMLDDPNSSICRWIKEIFGDDNFVKYEIYATNAIKCVLKDVATDKGKDGIKYLKPIFEKCKEHLINEIKDFKPDYIFTLGEPCYKLFSYMLKDEIELKEDFSDLFGKKFKEIKFSDVTFRYSPILHIQTYRVAKKYGEEVKRFEELIKKL